MLLNIFPVFFKYIFELKTTNTILPFNNRQLLIEL